MFQQHGASYHTSGVNQAHLDEATQEFIKKEKWPPRPDCKPLDNAIGGSLKEKVYPRSARQIDRAGVNEQDNNMVGGDID